MGVGVCVWMSHSQQGRASAMQESPVDVAREATATAGRRHSRASP
jgi:hypothetical protein